MSFLRPFAVLLALAAAPASASDLSGTLARISESGTVTLGYRTASPPMSYADGAGQPAGYSVALCQTVVEEIRQSLEQPELEVRYVAVSVEDRFDKILSGEIDLLCGVTTKTLSRADLVGFSALTFVTGGSLLSMDGPGRVESFGDLGGQRIAVAPETSTYEALTTTLQAQGLSAELVPFDDSDAAMTALQAGEVDVYAADQIVLIGKVLSQTDPSLAYYLDGSLFSFEPYALALAPEDAAFKTLVDRALARVYRSGLVLKLYEEWFGAFGDAPTDAQRALWQLGAIPE